MTDDDIIQLIETFDFDAGPRGGRTAQSRLHADSCRKPAFPSLACVPSDATISSTSSIGHSGKNDGCVRPFGRTAAPVEQAVRIIAEASSFGPASETSGQKSAKSSFAKVLNDAGILLGIKVDIGAKDLAGHPGETITEGLDGLRIRLRSISNGCAFRQMARGNRFRRWHSQLGCIEANAQALARYAACARKAD